MFRNSSRVDPQIGSGCKYFNIRWVGLGADPGLSGPKSWAREQLWIVLIFLNPDSEQDMLSEGEAVAATFEDHASSAIPDLKLINGDCS